MENGPLLTIITICRNLRDEIAKTCDSIAGQTWRGFEWIVVDGASTDGTLEILKRYEDRISILLSEKDTGIYNALNKGIRLARGEFILFVNGGDMLCDDGVLANVFDGKSYAADIIYGDHYPARNGKRLKLWRSPPDSVIDRLYFVYGNLNHNSVFMRRALFERFGEYDESLTIVSDWKKWVECAEGGCTFQKIDLPISVYDLGGISSECDESTKSRHYRERELVCRERYTEDELAEAARREKAKSEYATDWKVSLPGGVDLLSVAATPDGRKKKFSFFGIPIVKIGVVPSSLKRIYLFGIPVATIRE